MGKTFRIFIAIFLVLAAVVAARQPIAWAGATTNPEQSMDLQGQESAALSKPEPGSVKPPPAEITVCAGDKEGVHSVGGVSTLEIKDLAPGYCIVAFLRNHAFAVGRIPDGVGNVLAHITFVRIFYQGKLIGELPVEDGTVQICYAIPPGKSAQLYYFDFYGPSLGRRTGQPSWTALQTTVNGSNACSAAQVTGAYAIIGQ